MPVAPRPVVQRTVLLVGLGNYPYPRTRHSIGQYVLKALLARAAAHDAAVRTEIARTLAARRTEGTTFPLPAPVPPSDLAMVPAAKGWVARASVLIDTLPPKGRARPASTPPASHPYLLTHFVFYVPKQLMNVSGTGVAAAAASERVRIPTDTLLLHDELSRPFGKVSLKMQGSAAGHNGVRSVQAMLRSARIQEDVARVRIGIGRPPDGVDVASYVLGTMPDEWMQATPALTEHIWQAVVQWNLASYKS